MFKSEGVLTYGPDIRATIWVDPDIARYYRALIPKAKYAKPQKHPAHITVVRIGIEKPKNMQVWGKHEGEEVSFICESVVKFNNPYFYLDAWSEKLGDIREELGLGRYRMPHPESPFFNRYHITIGNVKKGC